MNTLENFTLNTVSENDNRVKVNNNGFTFYKFSELKKVANEVRAELGIKGKFVYDSLFVVVSNEIVDSTNITTMNALYSLIGKHSEKESIAVYLTGHYSDNTAINILLFKN